MWTLFSKPLAYSSHPFDLEIWAWFGGLVSSLGGLLDDSGVNFNDILETLA